MASEIEIVACARNATLVQGPERVQCPQCIRRFLTHDEMKQHVRRVHENIRRFECEQCEYRAKEKVDLVDHMRTYTGERSFACDICDMCLRQKQQLYKHRRTHTGEKPYVCQQCPDVAFAGARPLRNHMDKVCTSIGAEKAYISLLDTQNEPHLSSWPSTESQRTQSKVL